MPVQKKILEDILSGECITTLFQPVFNLGNGRLLGHEAFSRGPRGSELELPEALLACAKEHGVSVELEQLMRKKSFENAQKRKLDGLLFVNVSCTAAMEPSFREEARSRRTAELTFPPERTVFELCEMDFPDDCKRFADCLRFCRDGCTAVAIDNVGGDCVGLPEQCVVHPRYLKIDRRIVRGVDSNPYKKSLIETLSTLASSSNIRLIATGIETREELKTLIGLGVYAGQGFHLGRPGERPCDGTGWPADEIRSLAEAAAGDVQFFNHIIGEICEPVKPFAEDEKCLTVKNYLEEHGLEGVCTVSETGAVQGLVMKRHLDALLSRQYGFELFAGKPIRRVTDTRCITVDYNTPIRSVTEQVYARKAERTYDNIIVTRQNRYVGIVTFIDLLRHSTEIERSLALERNPLTGLPGNMLIGAQLDNAIRDGGVVSVVYFDMNHFKAYNDVYGFERGDAVIRMASQVIGDALRELFGHDAFLGHVGGDDYVAVIRCGIGPCIELCEAVIRQFDSQIPAFFDRTDLRNGFMRARDRENNPCVFSLTSIAAAGVSGSLKKYTGSEELARYISGLKHLAKQAGHSAYVIEDVHTGRQCSSMAEDDQMTF